MAQIPIPLSRVSFDGGVSLKGGHTLALESLVTSDVNRVDLSLIVEDANGNVVLEASNFRAIRIAEIGPGEIAPRGTMREQNCSFGEALDVALGRLIVANAQFEIGFEDDEPTMIVFRIRTETGYDQDDMVDSRDHPDFLEVAPSAPAS